MGLELKNSLDALPQQQLHVNYFDYIINRMPLESNNSTDKFDDGTDINNENIPPEHRVRDGVIEEDRDTVDTDDAESRKLTLIQQYSRGKSTSIINESTMKSLTRAIRLVIIPKLKFLPGSRGFGSFEQPDFTHPNCWVNKVFDRIANLKNASDKKKADVWMTYRNKIKEQFSLHRSSVTLKIKNAFCDGEFVCFHDILTSVSNKC